MLLVTGLRGDYGRAPVVRFLFDRLFCLSYFCRIRHRAVHRDAVSRRWRRARVVGRRHVGGVSAGQRPGLSVAASRLRRHRIRALSVTGGIVVGLVVSLCFVPVPLWSRAEGVIWVPDDAQIRAGADGYVREVVVKSGDTVMRGNTLIISKDPTLEPRNSESLRHTNCQCW